eukprot:1161670-Pelagomonas_calceolata.AAC.1
MIFSLEHTSPFLFLLHNVPGALAEYGSVARHAYSHASIPVLLIPTQCPSYLECEPANVGAAPAAAPALDPMTSPPSKESNGAQEEAMTAAAGVPTEPSSQQPHPASTEAERQVQRLKEERHPAPMPNTPFAPASSTPASPRSQARVEEEQRQQAERDHQGDLAVQQQREVRKKGGDQTVELSCDYEPAGTA